MTMITYISILRGINVGGAKSMLMSDLKSLYEELGYKNVMTFIQSGNVIFQTEKTKSGKEISLEIESTILQKFGFEVLVIVRTTGEIQKTLANNPYLKDEDVDREKLHVTLFDDFPDKGLLESIAKYDYSPDQFMIIGRDVFLYCPNGYGRSKLSNNFFEKKLKLRATTRNWRTISKLLELALSLNESAISK